MLLGWGWCLWAVLNKAGSASAGNSQTELGYYYGKELLPGWRNTVAIVVMETGRSKPLIPPHPVFLSLNSFLGRAFSSVQSLSRVWLFAPHELQHTRPPCPSPTARVYPNSCPLSRWCHPTISSSVISFSSCPQSFPVSGSFQMSQLFASGGQSIGFSASTSVLPMNSQDWFLLGWTGWISLQFKGLSRVFSNTTFQRH